MLRHFIVGLTAASALLLAGSADAAASKQCRDQKGHFVACAKPVAANGQQRCRSSSGKFVKCPASGMAATAAPVRK